MSTVTYSHFVVIVVAFYEIFSSNVIDIAGEKTVCDDSGSCSFGNYSCDTYDCEYDCVGSQTCNNANFDFSYPSVKILCTNESACAESKFNFHGGNNKIVCSGEASCVDTYFLSQHASFTEILCNGVHSCDGLYARNCNTCNTIITCDQSKEVEACTRITCVEDCNVTSLDTKLNKHKTLKYEYN